MAFDAKLLRTKLKEAGKTQEVLAKEVNKNKRTMSRWLNGENPPSDKNLKALANALSCTPQEFDPSFTGEGEVAIHARVSIAAHNAYELMGLRYGVSQRDIMELAPVMFSIVAGHALRVTEQDDALAMEAERLGLPSDPRFGSVELANGFKIDEKACTDQKCFGLRPKNPSDASPRNLFHVAIQRLCHDLQGNVNADYLIKPDPGEVPSAAGFIADLDWLIKLSGHDNALAEALTMGRVRLSKCLETHKKSEDPSLESFIRLLRREVQAADEKHNDQITRDRAKSLIRLKTWRSAYEKRHPDLAEEYDQIVENHCHEDGWYPSYYDEGLKELCWREPYREDRHINEDTLLEYQKKKAESPKAFHLPMTDPIYRRFLALEIQRQKHKAEFEGAGQ